MAAASGGIFNILSNEDIRNEFFSYVFPINKINYTFAHYEWCGVCTCIRTSRKRDGQCVIGGSEREREMVK